MHSVMPQSYSDSLTKHDLPAAVAPASIVRKTVFFGTLEHAIAIEAKLKIPLQLY